MVDMLAGLAGPLAALSVLVAAWHAGARDEALLVPAFLGFGWLALGETAHNVSRIVLGRVREAAAQEGLEDWTTEAALKTAPTQSAAAMQTLTLRNVLRQAPDGRSLGRPMHLSFRAGHPTALVGASGTGRTTLLKQIAGWIGADNGGQFVGDGVVVLGAYRRAALHTFACTTPRSCPTQFVKISSRPAPASEARWLALCRCGTRRPLRRRARWLDQPGHAVARRGAAAKSRPRAAQRCSARPSRRAGRASRSGQGRTDLFDSGSCRKWPIGS